MGQQGSHNGIDHYQKSDGSSDMLDNSGGSQQKSKIFKNLRSKNKSISSIGSSKHSKKSNHNTNSYNNRTALTSSPLVKECVAENKNDNICDENILHNVTDLLNSSNTDSELESGELNNSNVFKCYLTTQTVPQCIKENKSNLNLSLNYHTLMVSNNDVQTDKENTQNKHDKISPLDELYVDAKDQQSPIDETPYTSAPDNGSSMELSISDRPVTALSSTTLTPLDDVDKDCSLFMTTSLSSNVKLTPIMVDRSLKNGHKCVETRPYIVTSRLLSVSGTDSSLKHSPITSHNSTNSSMKYQMDAQLSMDKSKNKSKASNLINSKFGFSLESGMEATADYKFYNSRLKQEDLNNNLNMEYNYSMKQRETHSYSIDDENSETCSELAWDESDKDTDIETGTVKKDMNTNCKRFRYSSESSDLSSTSSCLKKNDRLIRVKCSTNSLSQVLLDEVIKYPRMVPDKLDFKQLEKFEGQMLISWLCSSFSDSLQHECFKLSLQDYKLIVVQFCTHLLAAGVIRRMDDVTLASDEIFRPDVMYYWAHTLAIQSPDILPGKLGPQLWPPLDNQLLTNDRSGIFNNHDAVHNTNLNREKVSTTSLASTLRKEMKEEMELLKRQHDITVQTLKRENASRVIEYEQKLREFEQEVEKCKILANIESLNFSNQWSGDSPKKILGVTSETTCFTKDSETQTIDKDVSCPRKSICEQATSPIEELKSYIYSSLGFCSTPQSFTKSSPTSNSKLPQSNTSSTNVILSNVSKLPGKIPVGVCPPQVHNNSLINSSFNDITSVMNQTIINASSNDSHSANYITPSLSTQSQLTRSSPIEDIVTLSQVIPVISSFPRIHSPEIPPPPASSDVPLPPQLPSGVPVPPPPVPDLSTPPPPGIPPPPPGIPPPPPWVQPPPPGIPPPPPGIPPPPPGIPPPPPGIPPPPPGIPPPPPGIPPPPPGIPPPPPGIPPPPLGIPPPPLLQLGATPSNSIGCFAISKSNKPVLQPKTVMKPLFWKKIQVATSEPFLTGRTSSSENVSQDCLWELLKEPEIDSCEFEDMFSKITSKKKSSPSKVNKQKKSKEVVKLLDSKRSQALGIFITSLHLNVSDIETILLDFELSALTVENLVSFYEQKPEESEITLIRTYMQQQPDASLDRPEQFIFELSSIPCFADRCFCFIFQSTFVESLSNIEQRLVNIKMVIEHFVNSKELRYILGMILAYGNYMNGGTIRGQADGFALDILSKLKDVKSKDNTFNLLEYLVVKYLRSKVPPLDSSFLNLNANCTNNFASINQINNNDNTINGDDLHIALPIPEPSDVLQAANVNFEDLEAELNKVSASLETCITKVAKVLAGSSPNTVEPFQSKMNKFISHAKISLKDLENNLMESKKKFDVCVAFFMVKPRPNEETVNPKDFFGLWLSFCQDFKDIWKKEWQKISKERLEAMHKRVKKMQEEKKHAFTTAPTNKSGLKAKLTSKGII